MAGDGRCRVMIEGVVPEINAGRYPIKRVPGENVVVEADIFADGHDLLSAALKFRRANASGWQETPMELINNDRWRGEFTVAEVGAYVYTIEAWMDSFKSWRSDLLKRIKAGQNVSVELVVGAHLVEAAASRASETDAKILRAWAGEFETGDQSTLETRAQRALGKKLAELTQKFPDRSLATVYARELRVTVDPVLARTGAWYEMFPRSCPGRKGKHGTFKDVEAHLPRVADMGFDVLYFPPIHPIGRAFRKGKNNNPNCQPDEPGSPWGIGATEGGHKAVHPELGTVEDLKRLVDKARELKIEIAMDIAWQCSPDHPWVREHPAWFKKRPDGSIQYAENPPKKYQDIYPLDFETDDWQALWRELKAVIDFWIGQGVRVFRVDNPHTKALPFWEWLIAEVKAVHPEIIFLAEAFTRPKLMYSLAKLGFTQSYNYFPWRNTKHELTEYFTELTRSQVKEFFRANLWPNTPDILTQYLQYGGRPAFMSRLILAATLGASYGIYGPAFELSVNKPRDPGGEEYLDSEKYEIKEWNLNQPGNLTDLISRVNRIRRKNPALQTNERLEFHPVDNDQIVAYSKTTPELDNIILVVVNLDSHHAQSGWLNLDLGKLGIEPDTAYQAHDLLTHERYLWNGAKNFVRLDPAFVPGAIFRLLRRVRTERDFDYFL
ncbi:MAG TPA: alpha-1,4-glucan--maltose-1-phosphate maltosyltransferase [Verrucomicrobiae bacterium]|nr:alpha-1,4-glucan--maltose-1-phosphate maltosyltransferase [Verrucomicrobiae bacterium]